MDNRVLEAIMAILLMFGVFAIVTYIGFLIARRKDRQQNEESKGNNIDENPQ